MLFNPVIFMQHLINGSGILKRKDEVSLPLYEHTKKEDNITNIPNEDIIAFIDAYSKAVKNRLIK
jgi:predicted small metal-binding protein